MSMYIEDDELRDLYEGTSLDQLARIEAGLLELEKGDATAATLESLLRDLHSLKGDSRMLGVVDAESIAHQVEELLGEVKQGTRVLSPEDFDGLYLGVDALRQVAREAISGQPAGIDPAKIVAQLGGSSSAAEGNGEATVVPELEMSDLDEATAASELEMSALDEDAAELAALLAAAQSAAAAPPAASLDANLEDAKLTIEPAINTYSDDEEEISEPVEYSPPPEPLDYSLPEELIAATNGTSSAPEEREVAGYQIDTIRVPATQLDGLAARAGELAVAKLRFERRLQDIDALLRGWEVWRAAAGSTYPDTVSALEPLGQQVRQLRVDASLDTDRLAALINDLEDGIRSLRLLPLATIFNLFPRTVRDLARDQGKTIELILDGSDILADKRILEEIKAPLTHLIRNAVDHGIESPGERQENGKSPTATLRLRGARLGSRLILELSDDGRGLDIEAIARTAERRGLHSRAELEAMPLARLQNLIFASGFSTRTTVTEISGRGVGLDVVRANIERLKGSIQVESTPGKGCTFRLSVGTDLSTTTAFIVTVNRQLYAIPVDFVETACRVEPADVFTVEGSTAITFAGAPVAVVPLAQLLELPVRESETAMPCIILQAGDERLGILVDELLAHQEIAMKPQSKLLQRVRNTLGATILGTGDVCVVLNPQDLIATAAVASGGAAAGPLFADIASKPKLLLVEDSIPIRTQIRRILDGAGYDVTTAVDGSDGWDKLRAGQFAGIVSDVEMPNLSGLELTERIRQYPEYVDLPIVLVTTLAKDSDRRRGATAGANAYLTKGDFDQTLLLSTLRRLI